MFDEYTETGYGLPIRSFRSFDAAAKEAAISRLYGGIHYRAAVENGQVQGQKIGEKVLQKIEQCCPLPKFFISFHSTSIITSTFPNHLIRLLKPYLLS